MSLVKNSKDKKSRICNVCGKEFDDWDDDLDISYEIFMGFGSRHDGERYNISLCCNCADEALESLVKKCKISPLVDDDYMTHAASSNLVIHNTWGPGKTICRQPLELGGKNLDCLNMDKIRAYVVSTFNIANGGFHNSVAVLMFDGTYYESIPKELSYEEYFESKINREDWEKINLENTDHKDVVLHIRKEDVKWFAEKREKKKETLNDFERLLNKERNDLWINAFEERMNEELGCESL